MNASTNLPDGLQPTQDGFVKQAEGFSPAGGEFKVKSSTLLRLIMNS